jgi:hypothetical protein
VSLLCIFCSHMAAMHLNRRFADAKFARDLLVEKASNNQHQYFFAHGCSCAINEAADREAEEVLLQCSVRYQPC